jgi:hypothetical protein
MNVSLLWVTRTQPHVDRCASAWLIKRFIDEEAEFEFISTDDPIPEGAIAFTLPKASIKPIEGKKTTYDVLVEKHRIQDPIALLVGKYIHDYEIDAEEDASEVKHKETLGLCYVLKGLGETSKTDEETLQKAFIVLDALYKTLRSN